MMQKCSRVFASIVSLFLLSESTDVRCDRPRWALTAADFEAGQLIQDAKLVNDYPERGGPISASGPRNATQMPKGGVSFYFIKRLDSLM